MVKAIQDAGFAPEEEQIHMTARGALEKRDGGCLLVLDRMKEPRSLPCAAASEDIDKHAGHTVLVEGRWVLEGEGSLRIDKVETPPAR